MNKGIRILSSILCASVIVGSIGLYNINSHAQDVEDNISTIETILPDDNNNRNSITLGKNNEIKISIMNDLHYFSKSLYSDCEEFRYDCKAEKKLLLQSEAILEKAMEQIKVEKPDVVLIGGDMSKDGERINHETVVAKLKKLKSELEAEGVNTKFYVTNGNHDINANARDYSTGETVKIKSVTATEFKEIYKDFGFGKDSEFYTTKENVGGGLSYVTDIGKGYTLIVVDTNKYTADQTKTGLDEAETAGMISDELLSWVDKQADKAYAKGNIPIVMQHHAITPHFNGQEKVASTFIVENYEKIGNAYSAAGIKAVFTGHSHASDIATAKTTDGSIVYDIMTSSLTGYPLSTRNVRLANEEGKLYLDTKVDFLESIDYIDEKTGENIDNIQEYSYESCMGLDAAKALTSKNTVETILNFVKKRGGVKKMLAGMFGVTEDKLTDEIIKMVVENMPKSEEEAMEFSSLKCNFGVFYNEEKNAIYLKQKVKKPKYNKMALELYVPMEEVKKLIEQMYIDIENNIINNTDGVNDVFQSFVKKVFEYKANGRHTVYDYYTFLYGYYKTGNICTPEDVNQFTDPVKDSTYYAEKFLKNVVYKTTKKDMIKLLSLNKFDLSKIIVAGNDNITTKSLVKVATTTFNDLGDVWKIGGKRCLLMNPLVNLLNYTIGVDLVTGLAVDNDIASDNDYSCMVELY